MLYFFTRPPIFESEDGYAACANCVPGSLTECGTEEVVGDTVVCEKHSPIVSVR